MNIGADVQSVCPSLLNNARRPRYDEELFVLEKDKLLHLPVLHGSGVVCQRHTTL